MVRNLKSLAFAAAACVLLAGSLSAQMATGKDMLVGVNGASSSYSNFADGSSPWNVYTSPYRAQLWINSTSSVVPPSSLLPPAGVNAFGPTTDIFCVDFNHESTLGTTYSTYFTNLGTNATDIGTFTRTGHTLQDYLESAFLAQTIESVGASTDAAGDINGAIWQIMSGSPTYRYAAGTWSSTGITSWVNIAKTADYTKFNARDWVVVTDVNAAGQGPALGTGGSQEYIAHVTPEPATLLLLGTGLFGMMMAAGAFRRLMA